MRKSFLYHASAQKNLKVLKPQRTLFHDEYIGDFVFATSDRRMAAMYLATKGVPTQAARSIRFRQPLSRKHHSWDSGIMKW